MVSGGWASQPQPTGKSTGIAYIMNLNRSRNCLRQYPRSATRKNEKNDLSTFLLRGTLNMRALDAEKPGFPLDASGVAAQRIISCYYSAARHDDAPWASSYCRPHGAGSALAGRGQRPCRIQRQLNYSRSSASFPHLFHSVTTLDAEITQFSAQPPG